MRHLTLVTEAPSMPAFMIDDELPPPIPEEARQAAFVEHFLGDLFKVGSPGLKRPDPKEVTLTRHEPPALPRAAAAIDYRPTRPAHMRTGRNSPKFITARFDSRCRETGNFIEAGDEILWCPLTSAVYCADSDTFKDAKGN